MADPGKRLTEHNLVAPRLRGTVLHVTGSGPSTPEGGESQDPETPGPPVSTA
ncbi:MAG TPA: hypothetical protein VFV89_02315 [Nocardioides sp.]|uniref:hypothetical protein n=1 Tax=Nocardioides sp. TaxID=35761 RepID=UPI002E3390C9|nr:hypothetical protein [Nocardioides sp.]HEX5086611.1 hypothetical protein [Nocardioides sp.]